MSEGVTYIDVTVYGPTAGGSKSKKQGGGSPEGLGDNSADVAGRIDEAVKDAVDKGDLGEGDIICQHNGKSDTEGGIGRLILRQPSHFDALSNDGKLDLYFFDPDACTPDEDGDYPADNKPGQGSPLDDVVILKHKKKRWIPKTPPWTPEPPPGRRPLEKFKKKDHPAKGWKKDDWRRWWPRNPTWEKAPKPTKRWMTSYSNTPGAPPRGFLELDGLADAPFATVVLRASADSGGGGGRVGIRGWG